MAEPRLPGEALARYGRQILLPAMGTGGQARLMTAVARVGGEGLAHEVAALYARRAGVGSVCAGEIDVDALAPAQIVSAEPSRALLAGSRAALAVIRAAAEVPR